MNNRTIHCVSIIIPTHNRAELLRQTLESLTQLVILPDQNVELLIIANTCSDQTGKICEAAALNMSMPLRCVIEPMPGASHARNRGLAEANGDILVFLDDDVAVAPDWMAGLLDVFEQYPADVVAGKVTLWWEMVKKPAWLTHRSEQLLSSLDYGDQVRELFNGGDAISANLAFRRSMLADVPMFRTDLDRQGQTVLAGGDTYFISQSLKNGHRLFYAPRAAIRHWVAPERLTLSYLSRAAYANGLARIQMIDDLFPAMRLKLLVENALKYVFYGVVETLAAVIGYQKGRINHRIRRMMCQGVLVGLHQRRTVRSTSNAACTYMNFDGGP